MIGSLGNLPRVVDNREHSLAKPSSSWQIDRQGHDGDALGLGPVGLDHSLCIEAGNRRGNRRGATIGPAHALSAGRYQNKWVDDWKSWAAYQRDVSLAVHFKLWKEVPS